MTLINLKNIYFLPERHSCDWIFKVENFLSEEFYNDIYKELNSTSRSPYLETYNSFKKGKNIKAIEDKVKANDDEKHSDWESYQKPVYKTQVVELNKTIKETQTALEKE